jgi:hypothetical protein
MGMRKIEKSSRSQRRAKDERYIAEHTKGRHRILCRQDLLPFKRSTSSFKPGKSSQLASTSYAKLIIHIPHNEVRCHRRRRDRTGHRSFCPGLLASAALAVRFPIVSPSRFSYYGKQTL